MAKSTLDKGYQVFKKLSLAETAVLQAEAAVVENDVFVIHCYFRPPLVIMGGTALPFSVLLRAHLGEILREGWRLHCGSWGRDSSGSLSSREQSLEVTSGKAGGVSRRRFSGGWTVPQE